MGISRIKSDNVQAVCFLLAIFAYTFRLCLVGVSMVGDIAPLMNGWVE